ncbi:MAG: LpqB family beta-propeller domain-containing protein [Actinomycetales bacterium]
MPRPGRLTGPARLAGALVALSLAAAACGGIPDSGPVHAGAQLDGPPPVRVLAAPPVPGASPDDIVRGFLRAQPGLDDDAAVARSYLTADAARSWASQPRVVVYPDESALHVIAGPNGTYTVTATQLATVTANGVYTEAGPKVTARLRLHLVRADGQWRISSMDDAQSRWLTSFDLDRVYAQVPLYYGEPGSRVLVPDLRWFPATSGLATVVARAQLEPPPPYLRQAVTTGALSGTALAVGSVPTAGNVASIDLTASARQLSSAERTLLWGQLAAAVTQVPGVDSVRVLAGDKLLDLPGQSVTTGTTSGALGFSVDSPPSASAVVMATSAGQAVLTQLAASSAATAGATKASLPSFSVPLRSLARSSDGREFAGVDQSGHLLLRIVDGRTTTALDVPAGLSAPSYDFRRWLWTAASAAGSPTRVYAVLATPGAREVVAATPLAAWLDDRLVTAVQISRDGARALVVSTGKGGWRLDIAGVQRDARGRPLALTAPLRVGLGLSDVADATWVDSTSVAVLARLSSDKAAAPYLVTVGAGVIPLPGLVGGVRIAAGAGADTITVVTSRGEVLARGGASGWVTIGHGLDVAFPG